MVRTLKELENGCGKKETHDCVRYYKSEVDSVETFMSICKKGQLCDECQMKLDILEKVRKYCNSTNSEYISFPELIKCVTSEESY